MSRWRSTFGALALASGFVLLSVGGVGALVGHKGSTRAATLLQDGRRAFSEGEYAAAFANFAVVLDEVPESAVAAHGAACALWRLGDGERAMEYEQQAVNYGIDFSYDPNNCFGSLTPRQLFRRLVVGPFSLLHRVPLGEPAKEALTFAREAVDDEDLSLAAAEVACVNMLSGLSELARGQAFIAQGLATSTKHRSEIEARLEECLP